MLVLGAETEFFGVPGAAEHGLALRTLAQAVALHHDLALPAAEGPGLPMVAPVTVQAGAMAAHNVLRALAGQPPQPFAYHDRGTMVIVGRNAGVARMFGRTFTGFSAGPSSWQFANLLRLVI